MKMRTNLILSALPPEHDTRRVRLVSVSISRLCSECQLWSNSNHFHSADSELVSSLLLLSFTMPRYVCPVQGYFENFLVCNYGPSANIWKVIAQRFLHSIMSRHFFLYWLINWLSQSPGPSIRYSRNNLWLPLCWLWPRRGHVPFRPKVNGIE